MRALRAGAPLGSARLVLRLHEALCFLRAYPDDAELLGEVERMLGEFAQRRDLRRHRAELADTGIAGTDIHYAFFAPMARWLVRRYPDLVEVDWAAFRESARLTAWFEPMLLAAEIPGLYETKLSARRWVARLKREDEADAAFLVKSFEALDADDAVRRRAFEELNVSYRIRGDAQGPSRTLAHHPVGPVTFGKDLRPGRPDLARAVRVPPRSIRPVPPREAKRLIELARVAMVTRSRDLDSFAFADPNDVRLVDCGDGLTFVCYGLVPEQRIVLEALYAFLTLKNGVPIGYVLASALFRSSEIAYNVFETFRGAEAGYVYGRILGMVHVLLGSDSFAVYPYQLGHKNDEGLKSGAWWFYQKLGFRPRDPETLMLMERELTAIRRDRRHRSDRNTLKRLARYCVFWSTGRPQRDVIGAIPLDRMSLAISAYVSQRFGSDRGRGRRVMADEAAQRLGLRSWRRWPVGERRAFESWSPLLLLLEDVEDWEASERRALVRVVRAKGGRRESDYVALFDGHRRLRQAVLRLAKYASA